MKEVVSGIDVAQVSSYRDRRTGLSPTFQLTKGVFLVSGVLNSAIYDTNTEKIYSVNDRAVGVISGQIINIQFWQQLQALNLVSDQDQVKRFDPPTRSVNLEFVWFEINSDQCNERCKHCYVESLPRVFQKTVKRQLQSPKLSDENWRQLIKEAHDLGARSCQFIGGEPFLYCGDQGDRVLDLVSYAKKSGFEDIEIFTNGTLVTEHDLERIKELGIKMAVSLYSSDPKQHDAVTQTPGSHRLTMKTLKRLSEAGITTRTAMVLMQDNQESVKETEELLAQIGLPACRVEVLRPSGRGNSHDLLPDFEYVVRHSLVLKPNFLTSKEGFGKCASVNSCLAGKIAISERGDVLPCIFSRDEVVGNILQSGSLSSVIEDKKIASIWNTTKDDILVCQDCEYRYACSDCRPLSKSANGNIGEYRTAPYPRCTYNPYEGQWGGGFWRLDETGKPYYDKSLELIIEQVRDSLSKVDSNEYQI